MRAMTERRRRLTKTGDGPLVLFFRCSYPCRNCLLRSASTLPKKFIETHLAFSRLPNQPKHYVQDLMIQKSDQTAEMLRSEHTHLYICGLKAMEDGVMNALQQICARHELD